MSVPNTNNFKFSDVSTELYNYVIPGKTLSGAFNDAIASGFDPKYSSTKTKLSHFRNYMNAPVLNVYSFIAPIGLDLSQQPLDLVRTFSGFRVHDNTAKYCYTVDDFITGTYINVSERSTIGQEVNGSMYYTYVDQYNGSSLDNDGNYIWSSGSTKRHVIVCSGFTNDSTPAYATIPVGARIVYLGNCYTVSSTNNSYLLYVLCENLQSITNLPAQAFDGCYNVTGVLTMPSSFNNSIDNYVFRNCICLTKVVLPANIQSLNQYTFDSCCFTELDIYLTGNFPINISTTTFNNFNFPNCIVHIPTSQSIGAIYYNQPWFGYHVWMKFKQFNRDL